MALLLLIILAILCCGYAFFLRTGVPYHSCSGTIKQTKLSKSRNHQAPFVPRAGSIALQQNVNEENDVDDTTRKYGLEAGLYKAMTTKDENSKVKPQDLLKKYGIAYLATSITLAIISYALCYALVSNGVDVGALLEKFGMQSTTAASNAGTAAIAYAVHKAASPIRFPPTVALTPLVANWLGKEPSKDELENDAA